MRAIAVLALCAGTAFADPPRLVVDRYDTEVCGRRGCSIRHGSWMPVLDGVELPRARFYALVGRPDLARAARNPRVAGVLTVAAGIATMAFGMTEIVRGDHPFIGGGMWIVGFVGGGVGLAMSYNPDRVTAAQAERLVTVARF